MPLVRIPHGALQISRERVQVAAAKKYDGICVSWGLQPEERVRLALYAVTFWGLVFPMRGSSLDQAARQLQVGVA